MDDEKIRQALAEKKKPSERGIDIPGPPVAFGELDDLQEFVSRSGRHYIKSDDSKYTYPCLNCADRRLNVYEIELQLWCHIHLHEIVVPVHEQVEFEDGKFAAETVPAVRLMANILSARLGRKKMTDETWALVCDGFELHRIKGCPVSEAWTKALRYCVVCNDV